MKITIEDSSDDTQVGVIDSTGRDIVDRLVDIVDRLVDRVTSLEHMVQILKVKLTKAAIDINLLKEGVR